MPKPCAVDLRTRVVGAYKRKEGTYAEMAARFSIGVASVSRWLRLERETGSVETRRPEHPRSDKMIRGEILEYTLHLVEDEPNWTTSELAAELAEAYGVEVDRRTVGAALRDAGYTYKRGVFRPPASKRADVVEARETFRDTQPDLDTTKLVFIDEAGVNAGVNRLYGWSLAGTQAVIEAKTRGKRLNVVAAIALDGSRAMMQYEGGMNEELFLTFIAQHLGPSLNIGDVVVLDGLNIHKMASVREAIESFGATVLILPAYSPELNPIEHAWSTFKARIRAIGTASWGELVSLAREVWNNLEDHLFVNWIRHCGYTPSGTFS